MKQGTLPLRLQEHYDKIDFTKGTPIECVTAYTAGKTTRVYSEKVMKTVDKPLSEYNTVLVVNRIKFLG